MSQERLIKMACTKCKRINYWSRKSKMTRGGTDSSQIKIELKKYCRWCKKVINHKETKK